MCGCQAKEGEPPGNPGGGGPADPSDPDEIIIGDEVRGLKKIGDDLLFYVNGAVFADLHYRINGGTQMNVAMHHDGGREFHLSGEWLATGGCLWNISSPMTRGKKRLIPHGSLISMA